MPASTSVAAASRKTVPPLDRPPESMRPDRLEAIAVLRQRPEVEIEPGVRFDCLVGAFQQARNLTTGIVTFAPTAGLPWHTHPFGESITLLSGQAAAGVEGRCYKLEPLDNVVIPCGLAHRAWNLSEAEPAVFHIAMATHAPTRTNLERTFDLEPMGQSAGDRPGAERVNRHRLAARFSAGPNTEFIDFFNRELMPGIEMSGGFGLFHPGGRLPAHVHDFDESISIIGGAATCIVEGRTHTLSSCATAMVPRGRVHYFRNDSNASMSMLWVYAGPMPERVVVAEHCATVEGNPWR